MRVHHQHTTNRPSAITERICVTLFLYQFQLDCTRNRSTMARLANISLGLLVFLVVVVESLAVGEKSPIIGHRRGVPGEDFPTLAAVPLTKFKCVPKQHGYYVDVEALCQVFHICQEDGRHDSFLCPNGTLFNQKYSVCDWWYNVDCNSSTVPVQLRETVTTSTARAPSRQAKSGILPVGSEAVVLVSKTGSSKEAFGSKMPSVNRMGGVNMGLMGNLVDASDVEMMIESTEAPTTVQPLSENESIVGTSLSVSEQLAAISKETSGRLIVAVKSEDIKALSSSDSRSQIVSASAAASSEKILSTGSQSDQATLERNPSSAVATVELNAPIKDNDDVTTISSLLLLDNPPEDLSQQEESTESVLTAKNSSVLADSAQDNLLTLEASTRPSTIPFSPASVLKEPGPLPTPPSGFLQPPPAVVSLSFQVITERPTVAGTERDTNATTTTTTTTTAVPVDRQVDPPTTDTATTIRAIRGYPRNTILNSTASILWPTTTESTLSTSQNIKSNDVDTTAKPTQKKATLNENLKPAIVNKTQPTSTAIQKTNATLPSQ